MRLRTCSISLSFTVSIAALSACRIAHPPSPPSVEQSVEQSPAVQRTDPWLLIESAQDRLTVFQRGKPPLVFSNIAVGAAGVKEKVKRGDDVTPRGIYQVAWIRRQSKFLHFIGLNYPSVTDAQRGLNDGRIDLHTFERIRLAHSRGEVPPQDTPLGGFIGIHGVGKGSLAIHRVANWTGGCVAVENGQIQRLTGIVRIGTVVEIR